MNVDTGEIKKLLEDEEINENEVLCPGSSKARIVMASWGKKKRQSYAKLVKESTLGVELSFYCVEFNNGNINTTVERKCI